MRQIAVRRCAVSATHDRPQAECACARPATGPTRAREPVAYGRAKKKRTLRPRSAAEPGHPACALRYRGHREQGQTGVALGPGFHIFNIYDIQFLIQLNFI